VRRHALIGVALAWAATARAGTLEDMDLRSNVEASIRGTAQTAQLHLKIRVEDRVAIPEGEVHDLNQADDVVELASKVKGIVAVDRSMFRYTFTNPDDDALAIRTTRALLDIPKFASSSLKVGVESGIVTLTGTMKDGGWRGEMRRLCGAIDGVTDVVDLVDTPATPDTKIKKVLDGVFGPRVTPRFPGSVRVSVAEGVVTLEGRVPRLYDRERAAREARGINGVRRVDNRLELGSSAPVQVVEP
jgi:osmotically-inducible protein OsmY